MDPVCGRVRSLAVSGLSAALAATAVLAIFGVGPSTVVAIGGLLLVCPVFAALIRRPELAAGRASRALPGTASPEG